MVRRIPSRFYAVLMIYAVSISAVAAHALERVTLATGFSVDCTRHEQMGEHVRLYTGAGDANWQDIVATQVVSIDVLPDPPVVIAASVVSKTVAVSNGQPTTEEVRAFLAAAGAAHDIDVDLLASVVKTESNFRVDAVSRVGARGLMQLMPGTAKQLGVKDATRADQNINGGTAYLDLLLKLYKDDVRLALAAYNAGPAAVAKYHGVPPYRETRAYVNRVITEFNRRMTARAEAAAATTTVASR